MMESRLIQENQLLRKKNLLLEKALENFIENRRLRKSLTKLEVEYRLLREKISSLKKSLATSKKVKRKHGDKVETSKPIRTANTPHRESKRLEPLALVDSSKKTNKDVYTPEVLEMLAKYSTL